MRATHILENPRHLLGNKNASAGGIDALDINPANLVARSAPVGSVADRTIAIHARGNRGVTVASRHRLHQVVIPRGPHHDEGSLSLDKGVMVLISIDLVSRLVGRAHEDITRLADLERRRRPAQICE